MFGRVTAAILAALMFAVLLGSAANAHPGHPHRTVGVRHHIHGIHRGVHRVDPHRALGTARIPQGTICKKRVDGAVKYALGGAHLFTLWESVLWCYVPGRQGFVSYDVTYWQDTASFAHWDFQGCDEIVRRSVRPNEYRYSRTGCDWRFVLPWPLPFGFNQHIYVTHTVRVDGTSEAGRGPR